MQVVSGVFAGLTWLLALGWVAQWVWWRYGVPRVPDLTDGAGAALPELVEESRSLPNLTVIVPACNEQAAIGATLHSLLDSRGVALQIIAVNDRSTDRTGQIMDDVASDFARSGSDTRHTLDILHIAVLPPGWLGKPHALATAAAKARTNWLLFTDGDVLFSPHALATALRFAESEEADHLVLMPDWITHSFGERAMHGAIHALSVWSMRPWRVADPRARDFLGVGAFNLIRRSTYESLGGFTALRMEVLEDLRLGWMVKRARYRQRIAVGPGLVSVRWSDGAWGVVRNLEKNLFALYRYNLPLALAACGGLVLQVALPLVALVVGGWARAGALVLYAAVFGIYVVSKRITRLSPVCFLLYPPAAALFLFAHLRSIGLALLRGGIVWRGTLYRISNLRENSGSFW